MSGHHLTGNTFTFPQLVRPYMHVRVIIFRLPFSIDINTWARPGWRPPKNRWEANASTFATLPLHSILGEKSLVAVLQSKGYTVESPE